MNVDKELHWLKRKIPGTKAPRWIAVVIVALIGIGAVVNHFNKDDTCTPTAELPCP